MKKHKDIKFTILQCFDVQQADDIINENFNFETISEKIAFLIGMFGVQSVGNNPKDEATYFAMLKNIIEDY